MNDDLRTLADGYLDGTLTDDETRQLQDWLLSDRVAKREFVACTVLHGHLGILADELPTLDQQEDSARSVSKQDVNAPLTRRKTHAIAWVMATAASVLFVVMIYRQPNRNSNLASEVDYESQPIPIRTVGYSFPDGSPEQAVPVVAGSNAATSMTTQMTAASGADVRVSPGTLFGFAGDSLGLLFRGAVTVSVNKLGSEYAVELGGRRIVSRRANFKLSTLDPRLTMLQVLDGSVEIQSRHRGPRLHWSFDGSAADDLPIELRGAASLTAGVIGSGAMQFRDERGTYAEIIGGSADTVGSGAFALSGGMTIEAVVSTNWDASQNNQDVIFRKEDGPNRILLSFQNNERYYEIPAVPLGPALSFGIFLQQLGYSELDMPLDGNDGRPTVREIADGKPHHLAATYDSFSGVKAIAVDGRICFSHRFPVGHCIQSGGPKPAMIGGWRNRESLDGVIDELAIYDYALSAEQIARHSQLAQQRKTWFLKRSPQNDDWTTTNTIQRGETVELSPTDIFNPQATF